jgi:hypothetical protein
VASERHAGALSKPAAGDIQQAKEPVSPQAIDVGVSSWGHEYREKVSEKEWGAE